MNRLVLASQSPRRAELLQQIGVDFRRQVADIDETPLADEDPEQFVLRMAREKVQAVKAQVAGDEVVLGSDTVVLANGHILGKPANQDDFRRMMALLSGQSHRVLTAVCVADSTTSHDCLVGAEVHLCDLSEQQIGWYWNTGEPHDKAGGYGIQGLGARFVRSVSGSYSAVVGLPLFETTDLLQRMGVIHYEC